MIAKMEFDLSNIDDKMAHNRCVKSTEMALALWEIHYNMYNKMIDKVEDADGSVALDMIVDFINDLFAENEIHIDELVI